MPVMHEGSNPWDAHDHARLREAQAALMARLQSLSADTTERVRALADANPETPPGKAMPIAPGWCAPDDMWDLHSQAQTARDAYAAKLWNDTPGIIDLPTVSTPAAAWAVPVDDGFAAVYDTGTRDHYQACHPDGYGGYWLLDATPIDHAWARPIVEDAVNLMNGKPPTGSIIKRLKGTTTDGK